MKIFARLIALGVSLVAMIFPLMVGYEEVMSLAHRYDPQSSSSLLLIVAEGFWGFFFTLLLEVFIVAILALIFLGPQKMLKEFFPKLR